jgi:hypothetical protein
VRSHPPTPASRRRLPSICLTIALNTVAISD